MPDSLRELPIPEVDTFLAMCRFRAQAQSDQIAFTYLRDGELDEVNLTYGELDVLARRIAVRLTAAGATGGRALLLYPPGLDYLAAFFGCIYAGVTAVPLYPPDPLRMDRTLPRLQAVCDDAQAVAVMGTTDSLAWVNGLVTIGSTIQLILATDALPLSGEDEWIHPNITEDSIAFLQYTSGSTGTPRGVMVTHKNMLYNVAKIDRGQSHGVVGVTWLPAYHDFGLVGAVLLPMYSGRRTISMSPMAFMQRPVRWLEAITRYGGTITGAPNFAYDLCSRTVLPAELERLDLSTLTIVLNGAEPVRRESLERFIKTFAPCGFHPEAFVPCYGLAEATLGVTGGEYTELYISSDFSALELEANRVVPAVPGAPHIRTLTACGQPLQGTDVAIVDPQTCTRCAANQVGEIWVRGPGVTAGYWNRPDDTESTFHAYLADSGAGPYLRTGDMGFLHEGEFYITGRLKDLIIICGRNHYPQDIERTVAACHAALKVDGGAAFSVERDGAERLVVVQEVTRPGRLDLDGLVRTIRGAILAEHDLAVDAIVLIKSGTIGKTTSGKIRRRACREDFLADRLTVVAQWRAIACGGSCHAAEREIVAPRTATEETLLGLWREVLRVDEVSIHDNFFDYGGHSLLATQLTSRVAAVCGVTLPLSQFFASPTVAELADVVDRLRDAQPGERGPGIVRLADRQEMALSFGQQRLWFVDQLMPTEPVNNLCVAAHIRGGLSTPLLERCLAELARRHESLRTTFVTRDGSPRQRVEELSRVPLESIDLSELSTAAGEAELECISTATARRSFDLETGPLWHVTQVRLRAGEEVLLLAMHHIISDGWSMGVLLRELLLIHEAFSTDRQSPLADLDIQYADFAAWQRATLADEVLRPQLDYWRNKLADEPAVLAMPTDRPRPALQTFRGAVLNVNLPATLVQALEQFSRAEQSTLFMTLLSAYQTLLARYTSQTDICVGTALAHRTRPEIEGLIGFFVNTLALRGDLAGDPTFRELLARTRQITLEAFENQDVPFERLVEEFAPRRALSHAPLYQTALVLQNMPRELFGPNLSFHEVHNGTARLDLTLSLWPDAGRLVGTLEYNTDLFDRTTIEHFFAAFETLLGAAVTAPDQPISQLALVGVHERQRLLAAAAGPRRPFADDVTVHELFERQVALRPDAEALTFADRTLSYQELNERSNQLAHHLISLGVGPEKLVGLCLERSPELVIGMLGILKAGGAYVPLDPRYPAARLDFFLRDAQLELVVTSTDLATIVAPHSVRPIFVDDVSSPVWTLPVENPPHTAKPQNLAYVIYTSGSTGQPKGVMVEHTGLPNFLDVVRDWADGDCDMRMLQFTSPNFDVSVLEIFGALALGGTLCMAPSATLIPGPELVQFLNDNRVSFLSLPPSALAALPDDPLPHVRTLVVAGEPCSPKLVDRWSPGRRMINAYGPTETTVGLTAGECRAGDVRQPPIGFPYPNNEIYVLDRHLEPVPHGMPGEVYIGGVGVGRGYWNRPELTAEKFVRDHLGAVSGRRLYRTGDLARHRADGNLEFLSRMDHQVKIRGFRIELGEIETALVTHDHVSEAIVIVFEQEDGDKRLVAYVGIGGASPVTTSDLHQHLKEKLPHYMIPSAFVVLPALPVTANGKVDRRALPAVERSRPSLAQSYVAPRSETEVKLAQIWADVIGLERVGIHDNFFELGGDSLQIMQVISRAARAELHLAPRQLFEHQTVAEQAAVAVPIKLAAGEQQPITGPVEFTPIQCGFFAQNLAMPEHFNQAVMLEVDERLDPTVLQKAVAYLIEHHDALRLRFHHDEQGWRQENALVSDEAIFQYVDRSNVAPGNERAAIEAIVAATHASLNLSEGPLVRVAQIDFGPQRSGRLLFVIHCLTVDVGSWRILLEDLNLVYQQLVRGQKPCASAKTTSYQEWARRLRTYAQSEAVQDELPYWQSIARLPVVHLPVGEYAANGTPLNGTHTNGTHKNGAYQNGATKNGYAHAANGNGNGKPTTNGHAITSRPGNTVASVRTVKVALAEDETQRLLHEAPRALRAQINGLLLAALGQAMRRWTGQESILIDVEGNGREELFDDVDLSRTVGWFTSRYPVNLPCCGADSRNAVAAVEGQLASIPRKGIGFGMLRYLCNDVQAAALGALPAREVSFNYLGMVDHAAGGAGRVRMASEAAGSCRASQQQREYLLEINGMVVGGRIQFEWSYSQSYHGAAQIERLADDFIAALRRIIAECQIVDGGAASLVQYVAPRDALEAALTEACEVTLGLSPIGVDDDLTAAGNQPQAVSRCVARFAAQHHVPIAYDKQTTATTIAELAELVRVAAARHPASPLVPIQRGGSRPTLFCVHPAGGSVFPYYALSHHLGSDQPLYALEARGLARYETTHESIEAMARDYIEAIRARQPAGPYYLAGWSFGGLVAYEMARQLTAAGHSVPLVTIIDSQPAVSDSREEANDSFAAMLALFPTIAQLPPEWAQTLTRAEKLAIFSQQVESAGLVQAGADRWEIERLYEVFETTCRAWVNFRARPYRGNVSIFRAAEAEGQQRLVDVTRWQKHIVGRMRVRTMPGNHLTMMREPHVRILASHLRRHLAWATNQLNGAPAAEGLATLGVESAGEPTQA